MVVCSVGRVGKLQVGFAVTEQETWMKRDTPLTRYSLQRISTRSLALAGLDSAGVQHKAQVLVFRGELEKREGKSTMERRTVGLSHISGKGFLSAAQRTR